MAETDMKILTPIGRRLKQFFAEDEQGTVAVEAAVIFPFLMWAFLAMFVFFDGYRQTSINHKAAYTVADMLSRETEDVTPAYVQNVKQLFDVLAENPDNTRIRLSVVRWQSNQNRFLVEWSETAGNGSAPLTNSDIQNWNDKLPSVPNQERVVLVESWSTYSAPFNIGMDDVDINTFIFTRLRFAPQLKCPAC